MYIVRKESKTGEKMRNRDLYYNEAFQIADKDNVSIFGTNYRRQNVKLAQGEYKHIWETRQTFTGYDRLESDKKVSHASRSVEENAREAFRDYGVPGDGVGVIVRWKSNGAIPFADMLLDFYEAGYIDLGELVDSVAAREDNERDFWDNVSQKRVWCEEEQEYMIRFIPGNSKEDRVPYDESLGHQAVLEAA